TSAARHRRGVDRHRDGECRGLSRAGLAYVDVIAMASARPLLDLTKALPPTPPILDRALSATWRKLSERNDLGAAIRTNRPGGSEEDRELAAAWLACRFDPAPASERIVVTNGTQSSLGLILQHLAA